jgi:beta-aspartyl-peptidase (threonine type)
MGPVMVGSSNARTGLPAAMAILRACGSALDAVEAAIRIVEDDPADHSVGRGGLPNVLGEVELDASIMDGSNLAAGAVAAVRTCAHPISLARRVMVELPHVLLVGAGADRFARECGFPAEDPLTEEARTIHARGLRERRSPGGEVDAVLAVVAARLASDPERAGGRDAGTVNVLALDARGHLASGVSTSGWAWKYPGRVGDSALIGAGNYCDGRWGACACTGRGEMTMRGATASAAVAALRRGRSALEAGREALEGLDGLADPYFGAVHCVLLDPRGGHAGLSTVPGASYVFMEGTGPVQERPRVHVPVAGRPA